MATIQINVELEVKEIIYDIQNKAFLTGQAREAGGINYEAASNMQVSDDEENSYQIRRSLSTSLAVLKSILSEHLTNESDNSNNKLDDDIDNDGKIILAFEMPSNYNKSSVDSLGKSIHSYLVDKSLADWFAINSTSDSAIYLDRSLVDLDNVKRALCKRSRPDRPTYN